MVKKIIIKDGVIPKIQENVSCIGYFDGVHLGHQKLIEETIKQANKLGVVPSLICFDPDPIDVIENKKHKHLLSYKYRLNVIESFGIKQIIVIKFDSKFMKITALSFIRKYLNKMNIQKIICGYDYRFGYKALGDSKLLKKNFKGKTIVIKECSYYGKKVSTTRIKQALYEGKFKLVNKLIGWEYYLSLKVNKCLKVNDTWLIEAVCIDSNCILPKDDTYGNYFVVRNNKVYLKGKTKIDIGTQLFIRFDRYE